MIRDVHSPLGMMSCEVRNNLNKQRAADCLTTSIVSLFNKLKKQICNRKISVHKWPKEFDSVYERNILLTS
jgi:hypothetical protein